MRHTDLSTFYKRNIDQGNNLCKGLFGYHQKIYSKPENIARFLSPEYIGDMSCENPYARNLWFDRLGRHFCCFLGIDDLGDIPQMRLYMLTVASWFQCLAEEICP